MQNEQENGQPYTKLLEEMLSVQSYKTNQPPARIFWAFNLQGTTIHY